MVEIASKVNKIIVSEIEKQENKKKYDTGFKIVSGEGKFGIVIKGVMMVILPEKYRVFDVDQLVRYFGKPCKYETMVRSIDYMEYRIASHTMSLNTGKDELMVFDDGNGRQMKVVKDLLKPFYFPGMIWQCKDEKSFLIGYSLGEPCVYLLGVR